MAYVEHMTTRLGHFLSQIHNLNKHCSGTLGKFKGYLGIICFLIFLLISCDLDMQLTVAIQTTYEGTI